MGQLPHRIYSRRMYIRFPSVQAATWWADKHELYPTNVRYIAGLRVQFYRKNCGEVIAGGIIPGRKKPGSSQVTKSGCGCGERAIKLVNWLGVKMDEDYVREHHFKASLKALLLRIKQGSKQLWNNMI